MSVRIVACGAVVDERTRKSACVRCQTNAFHVVPTDCACDGCEGGWHWLDGSARVRNVRNPGAEAMSRTIRESIAHHGRRVA